MRRFAASLLAVTIILLLMSSRAGAVIWQDMPPVPSFTQKQKKALQTELQRNMAASPKSSVPANKDGSRARVFMKSGDSHTASKEALSALSCQGLSLQGLPDKADLQKTLEFFSPPPSLFPAGESPCQQNSWGRNSSSALAGSSSGWALNTFSATDAGVLPGCLASETPLECENRIVNPSWALVMFGTNDAFFGIANAEYRGHIEEIIRFLRARKVIPVISSIPPIRSGVLNELGNEAGKKAMEYNAILADTSKKAGVPFVNLWSALKKNDFSATPLVSDGLFDDGVHLNVLGNSTWYAGCLYIQCNGADLSSAGQAYGNNRRNLLLLRTMNKIRKEIVVPALASRAG